MAAAEGDFAPLLAAWEGRGVVMRYDAPTASWIFIALHDDTLGPPVGGCRMMRYPRPVDGLRDALRLAGGMTPKWAAMGLAFGGGKAVLALSRPLEDEERRGLLLRFGDLLETLGGAFGTGEDLGTTPDDMRLVATRTRHVVGLPPGGEGPSDPGPFTAEGVLAGIRAALEHRYGSPELRGRSVLIQGIGDVGAPLARMVARSGARLLLADLDDDRARALAVETGGTVVAAADVVGSPCDVFAPCAVGAVLDDDTVPRLRCAIVAGSANNQLAAPRHADMLHRRGILYAPDYVINGGGAMAFGLLWLGREEVGGLEERVRGIGDVLREVFAEARERDESPVVAAGRRVDRVLAAAREGRSVPPGGRRPTSPGSG